MELPLFPLHAVLCPGVAFPLHIFEPRYRVMIERCIERSEPFGVVLITDGREVGPALNTIASIGTTAHIREAGRFPDGRLKIMTIGGRRFRIESVDEKSHAYLTGTVEILDEPIGDEQLARYLAERVSRRFIRYLELLQPVLDDDDGPEVEIEIEVETSDEPEPAAQRLLGPGSGAEPTAAEATGEEPGEIVDEASEIVSAATDAERHEILMAAARRLAVPDDPTVLSYVLGGLIQVELPSRQILLEAPDTASRLRALDALLGREIDLLGRRLKPLTLDPSTAALRRN